MAILVTGGAGYIGSHAVLSLIQSGYKVVVIDDFSNSNPAVIKRLEYLVRKPVTFKKVDIINEEQLEQIFIEFPIKAVIHFAGVKSVLESVKNPIHYYEQNVRGTITLCKIMSKYKVKKFVFSSSATVYGVPNKVPINEDALTQSINPYGQTKLVIENMLEDLYKSDQEWGITILRYFNPLGAHKSGLLGEDPDGMPNNLMPFITQVAVGKREQLFIYGNDYETVDGTGVRDYIHVEDLVEGHIKALENILDKSGLEIFNLGTGKGYSVLEVINVFEKVTGVEIPYKIVDRRKGDMAICYADTSKAEKKLGWTARKGIEEMCYDSWRWQKNNPNGYQDNQITDNTDTYVFNVPPGYD